MLTKAEKLALSLSWCRFFSILFKVASPLANCEKITPITKIETPTLG